MIDDDRPVCQGSTAQPGYNGQSIAVSLVSSLLTRHSGRLSTDRCQHHIACVHDTATKVPPKVVLAPLSHSYPVHTSGGGLHSLATAVLLTECSIEYSIGLLPISHTAPSDRMPSHIRHVSQPPSSIWITTAAPPPLAGTHRLLPSSHTDPSSSASTGLPCSWVPGGHRLLPSPHTEPHCGPLRTTAAVDAIRRGCCHPLWPTPSPRPCRPPTSPSRRAPSRGPLHRMSSRHRPLRSEHPSVFSPLWPLLRAP